MPWEIYIKDGSKFVPTGDSYDDYHRAQRALAQYKKEANNAFGKKDSYKLVETKESNPLKKYNVQTSSGKKFQIIAASPSAAREQVKRMFGAGTRIVNPKVTAANSKFLAYVKKQYNAKIFAKVKTLANTQGEQAAKDYMANTWNDKVSNPTTKVKKGQWIAAHAVRIQKGRLEILQ